MIPLEHAAIAGIIGLRKALQRLMPWRDATRAKGFAISHQLVSDLEKRHAEASG